MWEHIGKFCHVSNIHKLIYLENFNILGDFDILSHDNLGEQGATTWAN